MANPHNFPLARPRAGLESVFGPPGDPGGGYRPPLARVDCPWDLRLAWALDQTTARVSIHEALARSLETVFRKLTHEYRPDEIVRLRLNIYGGSYNPRRSRRSTRMSLHAWAAALDFDPENNRLKWDHTRATFARPEYVPWWRCWEDEGWVSLGRERDFDWMHVQAAKLSS